MVYDDDRDNPITRRLRRWLRPASPSPPPSPHSEGPVLYQCGAATGDGSPCRRTKYDEPGYRCHDHLGRRSLLARGGGRSRH